MQNQPEIIANIIEAYSVTDQEAERVQLRAALGLSQLLKSRQKVLVYITLIYFFKLTTWLQQIWGKKMNILLQLLNQKIPEKNGTCHTAMNWCCFFLSRMSTPFATTIVSQLKLNH